MSDFAPAPVSERTKHEALGRDGRTRVLELLRRHGWNATSFQVLERGFAYWFDPAADACVAYVDTGSAWVAAGAPIGPETDVTGSAQRFIVAARMARRRAVFFAVEDRFLRENDVVASMPIGEQPSWDPRTWPSLVERERRLREQLRRARSKGVVVRALSSAEMLGDHGTARDEVEGLVARWLGGRKMPPMGFVVDVQLFDFVEERRCFVAEHAGRIIGLLVAIPVYQREGGGWFFEDLLRERAAPNGTAELLIDAAMRAVGAEGSGWVTLGLAPLAGAVEPWMRFLSACSAVLYDFDGVRRFKAKLRPSEWSAIHLAWPREASGNRALVDALAAFTMRPHGGRERASFLGFGLETLAHAPALGVRVLALCLVPWTLAIALAPTERYFPSRTVQLLWVGWDVLLAIGLLALSMRWREALARGLAIATSVDAILTVVEVVADGAQRARHVLDAMVLAVACTGPLLGTALLWGALARRIRRADGR